MHAVSILYMCIRWYNRTSNKGHFEKETMFLQGTDNLYTRDTSSISKSVYMKYISTSEKRSYSLPTRDKMADPKVHVLYSEVPLYYNIIAFTVGQIVSVLLAGNYEEKGNEKKIHVMSFYFQLIFHLALFSLQIFS